MAQWYAFYREKKFFLVISLLKVLQTGDEINEIDNTGFATHIPTVYAGNLGNLKYIVQVTTNAIRLLQGK